jgi:predicted HD phosphohydrolase
MKQAQQLDEIMALFERFGDERYDEAVPQRDHARQTAAVLAGWDAPATLVVAGLFHDVGHLLELEDGHVFHPDNPDFDHEHLGANYLSGLFPTTVTNPIALHVAAKRYLVTTDEGYGATLSQGSQRSLQVQGGAMTELEAAAFAELPGASDACTLRRADDAGKVQGLVVPSLTSFLPLVESVLR